LITLEEKRMNIEKISNFARKCHQDTNCKYGTEDYFVHLSLVAGIVKEYSLVFTNPYDTDVVYAAAFCHDLIEDARVSYDTILKISNKDVADVVLAVTDVHAENRLMRHLLTMHKTVKDYRAIFLKLCDMYVNATYSKSHGHTMYKKYVDEYSYRKPIFTMALGWYKPNFNQEVLNKLWEKLDEIHNT
jgi:(p)ppGpp synthase/HD superfamily hydrolase